MFDDVFANLATSFSGITGSPFEAATAKWSGTPTYDSGGSIISAGVPESYDCQVQFDSVTQDMRAAEGFLETDVRMIVLASGLKRDLDAEARVVVSSGRYAGQWQILAPESDPAGIGFDCRGRKIS